MRRVVFLSIGLMLTAGGLVYAYDDGDFQIWHTEVQEVKLGKAAKAAMEEEFRYADDAGEFYYHHYDAGLVFDLCKNLGLGLNYRQAYEKSRKKFMEENRPYLNVALKLDLFGFRFEDRNRFEYRHFRHKEDMFRYRNKLTAKLPLKIAGRDIAPYIADEIFIASDGTGLNRNRFYSGLEFEIIKNIKGDVYYLMQDSESGKKWTKANVLGLKLKVAF